MSAVNNISGALLSLTVRHYHWSGDE